MKKHTRILIIEDEEDLLETLRLKLKKEGFVTEVVTDGQEGLERIKETKPDLLLLDVMLPTLSGKEVLKKIRSTPGIEKLPVVIISNSGQPVEIKELIEAGADDYIVKANFTIDDILERVYNVLEKYGGKPDIVIAEDEDFLRSVLAKKLRMEGYTVVTALDGTSALKTIRDVKPKLVILDLLMPGLSGIEILEKLKKDSEFNSERTKIVVLSNYSGQEESPLIKEMTMGYFIKSNYDIDEIISKIESFIP